MKFPGHHAGPFGSSVDTSWSRNIRTLWYTRAVSQRSTLFRIQVDLSNIDDGVYETFELRIAQHASEDLARVVTRILAHCLVYENGLTSGRGLDEADDPALFVNDETGRLRHWIDVGHPSAERMHRASKAAERLTIVCHKGAEGLIRERDKRRIHAVDEIVVWLLEPEFVQTVGASLERNVEMTVVRSGSDVMVTLADQMVSGQVVRTTLDAL